jgi:hypothetical protein
LSVQGGVVFLLFAVAAVSQPLLYRLKARSVLLAGLGLLPVALALIVAALELADAALFVAGTVAGGMAVGAGLHGQPGGGEPPGPAGSPRPGDIRLFRGLLLRPHRSGGGRGVAAGLIGTFPAVLIFSILVAGLCAVSVAATTRSSRDVKQLPGLPGDLNVLPRGHDDGPDGGGRVADPGVARRYSGRHAGAATGTW